MLSEKTLLSNPAEPFWHLGRICHFICTWTKSPTCFFQPGVYSLRNHSHYEMQMKCRINNILSIKYKAISSKIFPNLTPILWSFQAPYSNYTHCTLFSTLHVDHPEYFHQKVPVWTILLLLYRFGKNQALVTPSEGAFLIPLQTPFLQLPHLCWCNCLIRLYDELIQLQNNKQ